MASSSGSGSSDSSWSSGSGDSSISSLSSDSSLVALNSVTGDQITRCYYGTTLADSGVASFDLLRVKVYPDGKDKYDPDCTAPCLDRLFLRVDSAADWVQVAS